MMRRLVRQWAVACRPRTGVNASYSQIAAGAFRWIAERRIRGPLGKCLRSVIGIYAPSATTPKSLSLDLRSVRRLWGSKLSLRIRLRF
jgi:hypothetical protein